MNDEVRKLLERQAEWQKSRATLSWAEKVRMAEAVRESAATLIRSWRPVTSSRPERKSGTGVNSPIHDAEE
jgi:hypothetical protein